MQITRETDYAIRCLLHLARRPRHVAPANEIAAATQVPRIFLAKILQRLAKAGVVVSQRGVQGGFSLARDPAAITLLDAVEAVQGGVALNRCAATTEHCVHEHTCPAHPVWVRLSARLARDLARHTFQQLAQREKREETMRKGGRACPSTPTTRKR
jgi:Rrf2 family protein